MSYRCLEGSAELDHAVKDARMRGATVDEFIQAARFVWKNQLLDEAEAIERENKQRRGNA